MALVISECQGHGLEKKIFSLFLSSYCNTRKSLGQLGKLYQKKLACGSCPSSPKLLIEFR